MLRPSPLSKSSVSTIASLCCVSAVRILLPETGNTAQSPLWSRRQRGEDTAGLRWRSRSPDSLVSRRRCCTHTEVELLSWPEMFLATPFSRRFTQALICNHDILFNNNVSGQETSWVKMADARIIYGQLEDNFYKAGVLEYFDLETNIECCFIFPQEKIWIWKPKG